MRKKWDLITIFSIWCTKIHTRLDWGGEVKGGGADHADDDGVVEEDHGDGVSSVRPKTEFRAWPQIAPGPLRLYSGQDRVRLLRWDGDTVITLLWWSEWSLMRLKSGTFCADKYNKTNTFNLNDAFWQQSPVLTTPVSASEPCNNCKNCPIHPCGLRRNGYKASTLAIK